MSRLSKLIQKRTQGMIPQGIELATVIKPPPDLVIQVDNMPINLEGDDLIVSEHLLRHTVTYSTETVISGSGMSEAGTGPHTHDIQSLAIESQLVTLTARLNAGDRIAVQALPGGQQYLVLDKVVTMGA